MSSPEPQPGGSKELRSNKTVKPDVFIIKEASPAIHGLQLPTAKDILQHFKYFQAQFPRTTKKNDILYHPVYQTKKNRSNENDKNFSILDKIKQPWIKAGFQIISDISIKKNLDSLIQAYRNLAKNAKRNSSKDQEKQKEFQEDIQKVFWIGIPDLRNSIKKNKVRSERAKLEDLAFLDDQEGPRKYYIGSEDKKFSKKVNYLIKKLFNSQHPKKMFFSIVFMYFCFRFTTIAEKGVERREPLHQILKAQIL